MSAEKNAWKSQVLDLDKRILDLVSERFRLIRDNVKGAVLFSETDSILEQLSVDYSETIPEKTIRAVFREMNSGALAMTGPVTVAFLGPEMTFTHQAAMSRFGSGVQYIPQKTIADVFDAVMRARTVYGVVPVENSTEGAVTHTLDMFADANVAICAEINMQIHHNLLSNASLKDLSVVYSHPQVFGQCRQWLQENLHGVKLIEVSSTTEAARRAAEEEGTGALACRLAANRYGLKILAEQIEDCSGNTTRFFALGNKHPEPSGDDKTSIMFAVKDRVGALYDCLIPFGRNNINMSMIESRPSKKQKWEYYFYVDLKGHISEKPVKESIEELSEHCRFVKIIGSYPRAGDST